MTINIHYIEKKIRVFGKDNKELLPCTSKRAFKLVTRKCAMWTGFNVIQLLVNDDDRKKLRKEIVAEANRVCYICGDTIPYNIPPTLDHVTPKHKYGHDEKKNLKCCCKRCNDDKANRTLVEYVEYIKENREVYYNLNDERIDYLIDLAKMLE